MSVLILRYFLKEVLLTTVSTLVVLLLILISNQFVHFLNSAAEGIITPGVVFQVMLLQVPMLSGILLPMSFYLGLVLVIGRWCMDHELVALYACGYSKARLFGNILIASVLVSGAVAMLMLWVEPALQQTQRTLLEKSVVYGAFNRLQPGQFEALSRNQSKVFYAQEKQGMFETRLGNVLVARQGNEKGQWELLFAKHAHQERDQFGIPAWLVFLDGQEVSGKVGQKNFVVTRFSKEMMRMQHMTFALDHRVESLPTQVLLEKAGDDTSAQAELQWRFMFPISVFVFAIWAFALPEVNPRSGKFARIFPAVLVYVVYANLVLVSKSWISKGLIPSYLGMWWVDAVFLFLGLLFMWIYQIRSTR